MQEKISQAWVKESNKFSPIPQFSTFLRFEKTVMSWKVSRSPCSCHVIQVKRNNAKVEGTAQRIFALMRFVYWGQCRDCRAAVLRHFPRVSPCSHCLKVRHRVTIGQRDNVSHKENCQFTSIQPCFERRWATL